MADLRKALAVMLLPICLAFQPSAFFHPQGNARSQTIGSLGSCPLETTTTSYPRRALIAGTVWTALTTFSAPALAGIDVSGMRVEGGTGGVGSNSIADQLRAYDGSGTARIQELKKKLSSTTTTYSETLPSVAAPAAIQDDSTAATYAYRYAPGFGPRLTKLGLAGEKFRYEDQLVSPTGKGYLSVTFDFPSDWLQLDKLLGGIQYVDQRNGDKLYLLRAKLPVGNTLAAVPKKFFGDSIFNPQGTIVRSGIDVDEYKVKSSDIISDGSLSAPHRRLLIKYATVTGNGLRTERRALVDAYEVDSVVYMLMTSSNAAKFESMGRERDTVEAIVNSFLLEKEL